MKLKLSKNQLELLQNKDFIDQKNRVFERIFNCFEEEGKRLQGAYSSQISESESAKISRGENHAGYPYMVLDYPRIFSQEDIFAFRWIFWWGNSISSTLHLKGNYLSKHHHHLKSLLIGLIDQDFDFYLSTQGDEWSHNLMSPDYAKVESLSDINQIDIENCSFLKIALSYPLSDLNNLEQWMRISEEALLKPFA